MQASQPVPMDRAAFRELCTLHSTNAQEIAADCGLNRNTIRRWLDGTSTPVLNAAYAVAARLETDVRTLWPEPRSTR
jgi:transcriptional regulator with XRE-family HTH domain